VLDSWDSDAPVSPAVIARPPMGPPPISSPPYEPPYEKPRERSYEKPRERSYEKPRERSYEKPPERPYDDRPSQEPYDEELYRRGARSRRQAADEPLAPQPRRRDEPRYDETSYAEPPYEREHAEPRRAPATGRRRAEYAPEQVPVPSPRRYADEAPGARRHADAPTRGRHAEDQPRYDQAPPRRSEEPRRRSDEQRRYDDVPRRRGTGEVRAESGRHSRTEFVDLSDPNDPNYLPPDETPTLVDIAARRARKAAEQREGVRSTRRGRNRKDDGVADVQYWRQLRGEAQ
jgi:hypothetical protein